MKKHHVTCPSCGRDFLSACDDDTGFSVDPCPTCNRTAADYWEPEDWPDDGPEEDF